MKKFKGNTKSKNICSKAKTEKGAALVIVILVMLLLMGFVVIVLSRVNSETVITANDAAENRSLNAAQALVESNSQDFATLFQRKLAPTTTDIDTIRNATVDGFADYDFSRKFITQKRNSESIQIPDGDYAGLFSIRDEWEIDVTAKDRSTGVESRVKRSFNNDRIPLFQFGMFYEDDLELNRPPLFTFGGRVHTNANLFISANKIVDNPPSGGIYFNSKATVVGEVVNDIWKFGTALSAGTDDQNGVKFADSGGTYRELLTHKGSVKCVNPVTSENVFASKPNLPVCSSRPEWYSTDKLVFQGNLDNHKPRLNLPLYRLGVNLVELVKRGKNVGDRVSNGTANPAAVVPATTDDPVLSFERFANKPGIRISLADAQNRLPGCANVVGLDPNNNLCGVRLDINGGYQPTAMTDGANYRTTRLNATRFAQTNKQMWIKVEIVDYDYDAGRPTTRDITEDILSLGVTEPAPFTSDFQLQGYTQDGGTNKSFNDSRSIIKLQRFTIPGPAITNGGTKYMTNRTIGGVSHNLVVRYTNVTPVTPVGFPAIGTATCDKNSGTPSDSFSAPPPSPQYAAASTDERTNHLICMKSTPILLTSTYNTTVAPFPIQLFDTREGVVQDRPGTNNSVPGTDSFGTDNVTRAGAMSMIDIDVANLRRFLNGGAGGFDGLFPAGTRFATSRNPVQSLRSTDIPLNKGWVVYVSDRRGDADFDGEYDMEDVINDGVQQFNEDVNGTGVFNPGNGTFERLFFDADNNFFEAPRYNETLSKGQAATTDHGYYRRGVRLINGTVLPGSYDRLNPTQTRGFTFSSENGVYVQGNYNAEGVTLTGTTAPAPPQNYSPQGGTTTQAGSANATNHIPAAIVSDATTILSNAWNDSKSFATPFAQESRVATATQIRFALLTGDVVTGKNGTTTVSPSATGGLGNGGVHNFKRYLEVWTNVRLNYTGSLVNLFNSRNNNGYFKCCEAVYNPPIRDWSFDTTFLDPNRLPPGTPYIYSMSLTGFQRVNE